MDLDAMEVPVDHPEVPDPQSAQCTLHKSSEKIQDNDGPDSDEDEDEDEKNEDVGPSESL